MPNNRSVFIHGNLNDANDTSYTGMSEPITGLQLPSGLVLGDFTQWTPAEVVRYTNTAVGTLYSGWYQRVYLDPTAATLKRGQLLWWVQGGTYKHQVTNVEPADLTPLAGIYINSDTGGVAPVTPGNFFFMQAFQTGGLATVLMASVLTGVPVAGQSVFAAGLGAGADNATCDIFDGAGNPDLATVGNMLNRFVGKAMALPVAGGLLKISLPGRSDVD